MVLSIEVILPWFCKMEGFGPQACKFWQQVRIQTFQTNAVYIFPAKLCFMCERIRPNPPFRPNPAEPVRPSESGRTRPSVRPNPAELRLGRPPESGRTRKWLQLIRWFLFYFNILKRLKILIWRSRNSIFWKYWNYWIIEIVFQKIIQYFEIAQNIEINFNILN